MLPIDFPLIKDAQIQYGNLALGEAASIPLGLALWWLRRRLLRPGSWLRRAGGILMLVMAVFYTLGWLGINGLVLGSALGWL